MRHMHASQRADVLANFGKHCPVPRTRARVEVSRYNKFRRNCCEVRQVEHRALKELAAARVNDERVREIILSNGNAGPQVQDSPSRVARAAFSEST
jgi:hypothetical protein